MFGGYGISVLGDTWLWSGTTWTQANPASSPSARYAFAMTYDAAHSQVVLFGGRSAANGWLGDTWLWNGTTWTQASPAASPASRSNMTMVYDAAQGNVVLFGGAGTAPPTNDTWIWNGTTWTQAAPAHSPTARQTYSMVYDATHGQVVLFGGLDAGGNYLNDTWTWNGTDWTQQSPATLPGARFAQGMAYDASQGDVVMFGGVSPASALLNDTWVWNGTDWTLAGSQYSPFNREVPGGMASDSTQGQVILFGGFNPPTDYSDTWIWGLQQSFGNVNVCPSGQSTPAPCSVTVPQTYNFATTTTIGAINVVTQGASSLDFTQANGGNCAGAITAGSSCTLDVTFTPRAPGLRMGAVQFVDNLGSVLTTTPIYGVGQGPEIAFSAPPAAVSLGAQLLVFLSGHRGCRGQHLLYCRGPGV